MSDWRQAWQEKFPGWDVGGFWVGPPWETPPEGLTEIIIDPRQAQGTGLHPCTRLCLLLLDRLRGETFASVLDVGCGTGVLGIAAAKIGLGPVKCVDRYDYALEETQANADRNGVEVETRLLDIEQEPLPQADLVIADFGSPKLFPFPLVDPKVVITSGYDTSQPTPSVPGLNRTQVSDGDYRGHLHR